MFSGITSHPNQYYSESVKGPPTGLTGSASQAAKVGVKTERAVMYTKIDRGGVKQEIKKENEDTKAGDDFEGDIPEELLMETN